MILLVLMTLCGHVNRLARDPSFLSTVLASSIELFPFQQLVHLLSKGWPGYFARSWRLIHNASAAVCALVLPTPSRCLPTGFYMDFRSDVADSVSS